MRNPGKSNNVYGPVLSRRLGFSLGIDIVPGKTCSFDCCYCQLGKTLRPTLVRRNYVPVPRIVSQVRTAVAAGARIDYLTFSGSGEPTLHSRIGEIINAIKQFTAIPVAVITNGSLLFRPEIRRRLAGADLVLPTLCAATDATMRRINRHHRGLSARRIIAGIKAFTSGFKGSVWLEIMLVRGLNDSRAELARLKKAVAQIKPDRVQLNTVVRPPCDASARPLAVDELERIRKFFGKTCEIIADFKRPAAKQPPDDIAVKVLATVNRRPVTAGEIRRSLGIPAATVKKILFTLRAANRIRRFRHGGRIYYQPRRRR